MELCGSRINLDRATLDFAAKQGAPIIRLEEEGASWSLANLKSLPPKPRCSRRWGATGSAGKKETLVLLNTPIGWREVTHCKVYIFKDF